MTDPTPRAQAIEQMQRAIAILRAHINGDLQGFTVLIANQPPADTVTQLNLTYGALLATLTPLTGQADHDIKTGHLLRMCTEVVGALAEITGATPNQILDLGLEGVEA